MARISLGTVIACLLIGIAGCTSTGGGTEPADAASADHPAGSGGTGAGAADGAPDVAIPQPDTLGDDANVGDSAASRADAAPDAAIPPTDGAVAIPDAGGSGDTGSARDGGVLADAAANDGSDGGPIVAAGDAGIGWATVPSILARIIPPTFPARDCVVTDAKYGGVGDGRFDNTAAFAAAIADCVANGGGNVIAPATPAPAIYSTGPIELKSNINLNIPTGATIRFISDPTKYLPTIQTSFEGSLLQNYKPLVSAHDATNIAITGGGTLDGNATANDWYAWGALSGPDSLKLRTQNANGVPPAQRIYGAGHFLRPSLIEVMHCTNILFDGFTAKNSPFWTIHPVMSRNVTGHNVTSLGSVGNTDGFDPESCVDVHLDGLTIMVGDDPIAIKAGRDLDGRTLYTPTENVVIENCVFGSNNPTHGASIAIGSEMSGGVKNVYVQNITFHDVPGILAQAIYLKASIYRGGYIQDFYARQLHVDSISTFFFLNGQYIGGTVPATQPIVFTKFSNINVDGATVQSVTSEAFRITGPDSTLPATGIHISNVTVGSGTAIRAGAAHYSGLTMSNVTVNGTTLNPPASVP